MDALEAQAKALDMVYAAISPRPAPVTPEERAALLDGLYDQTATIERAESAMEYLRANVRRLCQVRYAASAILTEKAHRFYAELPIGDGDDFRDFLLAEVRMYAGQFPAVGVEKRAEITAALAEVMQG